MKRSDLLRHLHRQGCELLREGRSHTVYWNRSLKKVTAVPRHTELGNRLAQKICRDLGVPAPGQ
jgi:mRNA interferase HicA